MAVIPNYYFQNPSIEAASRNLASALMPPDPEKTLAAQRAKWEFQREQELAQRQNEMYNAHVSGRQSLGDIYLAAMQAGKPMPASSPGEAAYNDVQFPNGTPAQIDPQDLSNVLSSDVPIDELNSALGSLSPEAREKFALAVTQGGIRDDMLTRTLDSREAIAARNQQGITDRLDKTDARLTSQADLQRNFLANQWELNRQSRERTAKLRRNTGASGNQKPINISPAQREVLRKSHQRWFRSQGIEPPVPLLDAMTDRSLQYYEEGYNNAPDLARAEFLDSDKQMTPEHKHWYKPDEPAQIPLKGGLDLGDIVTMLPRLGLPEEPEPPPEVNPYLPPGAAGTPAGPTPPTKPPPTAPSPERLPKLKENTVVTFPDGEAWGMIGGKPIFISPEQLRIIQGAQQ